MAQANVQYNLSANDQTARAFANVLKRVEAIDDATTKLNSSVSNFGRLAVSAFAAIQVGQTAKSVGQLADQFNLVNARLKVVTDSTKEFSTAQKSLFEISQNTRISYSDTVDLFTQLTRQTKDLNIPQEKMLKLTEGINKALIVSGATGQSALNALIQLGQGFAGGALRGAEFMSVQEQAPRILEAVREGLGKTQGELKKMADEGKLTTAVFIEGFFNGMQRVENEFSSIPVTISQAMKTVSNAVMQTIGDFDKMTGASESVAKSIQGIGDSIMKTTKIVKDNPSLITGILTGVGTATSLGIVAAKWEAIKTSILAAVGAASTPAGLAVLGIAAVAGTAAYFKSRQDDLDVMLQQLKLMDATLTNQAKFNRMEQVTNDLLEKRKALMVKISAAQMELYGYPGQDYPDEIARKKGSRSAAAPLPTKEDENAIKNREKMLLELKDKLLQAEKGERALYEAQAKRIGFSGKALESLMAQYDQLNLLKSLDKQMDDAIKQFSDLDKQLAKSKQAQEDYAKRNEKILEGFKDAMSLYQDSFAIREGLIYKTASQIEMEERLVKIRKKYEDAERQIRFSNDENKDAKLKALEEEYAAVQKLIRQSRDRKEMERNDLIDGGIKGYKRYLDSISDFANQSESMVVRAFSNMEDAMVSFVTNGKFSFRDMAQSIVQDLIRIHVRQQMVGLFGGGTGSTVLSSSVGLLGNIRTAMTYGTNIGSQQTAMLQAQDFDGGGYTGSGSRSGGLDGNGGFMAMLHPNETVIDHSRGQSGGGTTIVQNINVTTGVAQTVRAEIMSLMPQIANAAKSAVADAKLRGGSYAMAMR